MKLITVGPNFVIERFDVKSLNVVLFVRIYVRIWAYNNIRQNGYGVFYCNI